MMPSGRRIKFLDERARRLALQARLEEQRRNILLREDALAGRPMAPGLTERMLRSLQVPLPTPVLHPRNEDIDLQYWRGDGPAEDLQQHLIREADTEFENRDLDRFYWHDPGAEGPDGKLPRRGAFRPVDDKIYPIPGMMPPPDSVSNTVPFWVVGIRPPWVDVPYMNVPVGLEFTGCIPTWEQDYLIGSVDISDLEMMVIKGVSYEWISGIQQQDVFEIKLGTGQRVDVILEDIYADNTAANPAQRYAMSGHTRPHPTHYTVDRNKRLNVWARARGIVTLAGVANHLPGDPLVPNANVLVTLVGWMVKLRRPVDGAPRHTDFGNQQFFDLDPVGSR